MQQERSQYLNAVSASENRILEAMGSGTPELQSESSESPPEQKVNATAGDQMMFEILKLLKDLKEDRKDSSSRKRHRDDNELQNGHNKKSYRTRTNVSKYCWSHGACSHTGKECTKRNNGHKEEATFKNKLGGSIRFCPPCV